MSLAVVGEAQQLLGVAQGAGRQAQRVAGRRGGEGELKAAIGPRDDEGRGGRLGLGFGFEQDAFQRLAGRIAHGAGEDSLDENNLTTSASSGSK